MSRTSGRRAPQEQTRNDEGAPHRARRRGSVSRRRKTHFPQPTSILVSRRGRVRARKFRRGLGACQLKIPPALARAGRASTRRHPTGVHPGARQGRGRPRTVAKLWSGRRDSNPRRPAWKARALPTELLPLESITYARFQGQAAADPNWRAATARVRARRPNGGGGRIRTSEGFADRFTVCSL